MIADLLINSFGFPDPAFRIESSFVSLDIFCKVLLQRKYFVLFVLSMNLCILPLPIATRLMIIWTLPLISMCTLLCQHLFKVDFTLHFSLFCASPVILTLSQLTGNSGHVLLLLFTLYPAKNHLPWSYYLLHHQKITAFVCNILSAEKNGVTLWKLSGQRDIKYVQIQENKNLAYEITHLYFLNLSLLCFKF